MKPYLTTTTLLPVRTSLATMEGSLPMRWPRPSTTIALGDMPGIFRNTTRMTLNKGWKFIFPLESNNPVRILFPEVIQILCEFILEMGLSILFTIPFPTSLTCSNFRECTKSQVLLTTVRPEHHRRQSLGRRVRLRITADQKFQLKWLPVMCSPLVLKKSSLIMPGTLAGFTWSSIERGRLVPGTEGWDQVRRKTWYWIRWQTPYY